MARQPEPDAQGYLRVTLVKGTAGCPKKQLKVLHGLGLKRSGRSVVRPDTPAIRGMIHKVTHMVEVRPAERDEVTA